MPELTEAVQGWHGVEAAQASFAALGAQSFSEFSQHNIERSSFLSHPLSCQPFHP